MLRPLSGSPSCLRKKWPLDPTAQARGLRLSRSNVMKTEAMDAKAAGLIILGKITGVFGVQGWVKVYSGTEPRSNILDYSPWYLHRDGQWQSLELEAGKVHGKGIIAHLAQCPDRDVAMGLVGAEIAIRREQLPPKAPGEYYWDDLIGLKVINQNAAVLGVVENMLETGANDVLVVRPAEAEVESGQTVSECLIPYIQGEVITEIDLEQGLMRVNWDVDY